MKTLLYLNKLKQKLMYHQKTKISLGFSKTQIVFPGKTDQAGHSHIYSYIKNTCFIVMMSKNKSK